MSKKNRETRRAERREERSEVWIRTEPTLDGKGYAVTLEYGDDKALGMDRSTAQEYAHGLMRAATWADYQASLLRMLSPKTGVSSAMLVVQTMRDDLPPIAMPAPFEVTASVTQDPAAMDGFRGFLEVSVDGRPDWQWAPHVAVQHALSVLNAVDSADFDSAQHQALTATIDLDPRTARAVVEDSGNFRTDYYDLRPKTARRT